MLFGTVDAQSLRGDLELARGVSEAGEGKDPHDDADRLGLEILQRSHVQSLGTDAGQLRVLFYFAHNNSLIPQPVSEVDAFDHRGGPFVAGDERDGLEHILDVAMAPVLPLDGGDGGNV